MEEVTLVYNALCEVLCAAEKCNGITILCLVAQGNKFIIGLFDVGQVPPPLLQTEHPVIIMLVSKKM